MNEADVMEMVTRHDEAINHVTSSIDRLANAVEKTDDKMDKVIEALSQNAVILEKIANIDSSNKDSVNRLHKRIDDVEKSIEHKEDSMSIRISQVAIDANKGGKLYDIAVYTAKALAWALPITVALMSALLWLIKHS
jgi:tetrahydromethanopterin S-methyltransferase subunit G